MEITCTDGKMRIRKTSLGGWSEEELRTVDHPGQVLREIIDENRTPELPGIPTFTGVRSADLEQSHEKAEAKLNEIEKLLKTGEKMEFPPIQLKTEIKPQFSEEKYEKMVERSTCRSQTTRQLMHLNIYPESKELFRQSRVPMQWHMRKKLYHRWAKMRL